MSIRFLCRVTITAAVLCSMAANAVTPDASIIPLQEWVNEYTAQAPVEINGLKIYRPRLSNGTFAATAYYVVSGQDKDRLMYNALLTHIDNAAEEEQLTAVDMDANTLTVSWEKLKPEGSENAYSFDVRFRMENGMVVADVSNIKASYKLKGIIPTTQPLEKLKPYKSQAEAAIYEEAAQTISAVLAQYFAGIQANKAQPVTHFDELAAGEVVAGMNATEVKFILGAPQSTRKTGANGERWVFPFNTVVVFSDGKVSRVVR